MSKEEYFEELREIVEDRIYLTESEDELAKEIQENMWSISLNKPIAVSISPQEIKAFLGQVKQNRQIQLQESDVAVDLIYYLWYDSQVDQLRFNFINHHHKTLPFKATIEITETEEEIIERFLTVEDDSEGDSLEVETEYIVKVYSEVINKE